MHIYSVNDPEFKSYGNVWDNVPSELTSPVLEALSATPIPEGSKYVASAPELEDVKDADKLGFLMFGGRPFQLGWKRPQYTTQLPGVSPRERIQPGRSRLYPARGASLGDRGRQARHRVRQGVSRAGGYGRRSLQHHAPLHAVHGRRRWLPGDGGAARRHQRVLCAPRSRPTCPRPATATATGRPTSGSSAMLTAPRQPKAAT